MRHGSAAAAPYPAGYCVTGKRAYRTKADAKRHYRRELRRRGRLYAYRCPYCAAVHLTSMPYADRVRAGLVPEGSADDGA